MINVVPTELKRPANVSPQAWARIVTAAALEPVRSALANVDHRDVIPNGQPYEGNPKRNNPNLYYTSRKSHRGPASRSAMERRVLTSVVAQISKAKQQFVADALGVDVTTVSTNLSMFRGYKSDNVFNTAVRDAKARTILRIIDPRFAPALT